MVAGDQVEDRYESGAASPKVSKYLMFVAMSSFANQSNKFLSHILVQVLVEGLLSRAARVSFRPCNSGPLYCPDTEAQASFDSILTRCDLKI